MVDFEILRNVYSGGYYSPTETVRASSPDDAARTVTDPKAGEEMILVRFVAGGGVTPFIVAGPTVTVTPVRPSDLAVR